MTCQEANDAQFEQQLAECDDVELLKAMLRQQRKELNEVKFAARLNAETIKNRTS